MTGQSAKIVIDTRAHPLRDARGLGVVESNIFWTENSSLYKGTLYANIGNNTLAPSEDGTVLSRVTMLDSGPEWKAQFTFRSRPASVSHEAWRDSPSPCWERDGDLYCGRIQQGQVLDKKVIAKGLGSLDALVVFEDHIVWSTGGRLFAALLGDNSLGRIDPMSADGWGGTLVGVRRAAGDRWLVWTRGIDLFHTVIGIRQPNSVWMLDNRFSKQLPLNFNHAAAAIDVRGRLFSVEGSALVRQDIPQ